MKRRTFPLDSVTRLKHQIQATLIVLHGEMLSVATADFGTRTRQSEWEARRIIYLVNHLSRLRRQLLRTLPKETLHLVDIRA